MTASTIRSIALLTRQPSATIATLQRTWTTMFPQVQRRHMATADHKELIDRVMTVTREASVTLKDFTDSELKTLLPWVQEEAKKSVDQGHSSGADKKNKDAVRKEFGMRIRTNHEETMKTVNDNQGEVFVSNCSTTVTTFAFKDSK